MAETPVPGIGDRVPLGDGLLVLEIGLGVELGLGLVAATVSVTVLAGLGLAAVVGVADATAESSNC